MFATGSVRLRRLIAAFGFLTPGGPRGLRLVHVCAAVRCPARPGVGGDLGIFGLDGRFRHHPRCASTSSRRSSACAPGHDDVPDADVHLELVTSLLSMIIFPVLAAPLRPRADRRFGHTCSTRPRRPILWQHLFWFFGHPGGLHHRLPFFGIMTEILPGLQPQADLRLHRPGRRHDRHRDPLGRVWAHRMFVTGASTCRSSFA